MSSECITIPVTINYLKQLFLFLLLLGCTTVFAQKESADDVYTFKQASRDGTGKIYHGREIARVMSFEGKDWLERANRPEEENTDLAVSNLPVTKSSVVADIGAGSGYYTFRIAEKVSAGKVYAVEIQKDAVTYLKERSKKLNLEHVYVVKGNEKSPNLPDNAIDMAVMVDVYHELLYPQEMLQAIRKSLKPNGKLLLIEYRGEDPQVAIKKLHKMSVKQVDKELVANGFRRIQNGQFMNIQHFLVYQKQEL